MCVRISRSFTITEEKMMKYASLSGDFNPIHLYQDEAERSGFKAPIAHGMLTMGLSLDIVSSFTEKGMMVFTFQMQFLKPIYMNDTIHLVAKIMLEGEIVDLFIEGRNNENEAVVRGKLSLADGDYIKKDEQVLHNLLT
ncbi:MaoC family dehydratase [Metabacillus sediminilitoris]|nr:MaoC family dehydratase [Metabacillus sediminilitoris]